MEMRMRRIITNLCLENMDRSRKRASLNVLHHHECRAFNFPSLLIGHVINHVTIEEKDCG